VLIWISKYLILTFIRDSMLKDCVQELQNCPLSELRVFDSGIELLMTLEDVTVCICIYVCGCNIHKHCVRS